MPVSLPQLPQFIQQGPGINTSLHLTDHGRYMAVFSRFGGTRTLEFLGVASVELTPEAASALEEVFAEGVLAGSPIPKAVHDCLKALVNAYKGAAPSNPNDYLSQFTVAAGRYLFTGHLMAIRREPWGLELPDDVVEATALRFRELSEWGETSPAFILANELGVPLSTVHSRIRLAKERGLIERPGWPVRRQRKDV